MNLISTIIGVLSFNETPSQKAAWLQRLYYIVCYNTTLPVNAMLALGSIIPYLVYALILDLLTPLHFLQILSVTLFSAYAYSYIYIVNDFIDREKDKALAIPKQSARHIVGMYYGLYSLAAFALIALTIAFSYGPFLLPAVGYVGLLIVVSIAHSYAHKWKLLTVFLERYLKFTSPFWLIALSTHDTLLISMLTAASLVYPFGFTLDYAFKGYMSGRLKVSPLLRLPVYGVYWLIIAAILYIYRLPLAMRPTIFYIATYFAVSLIAILLAKILPQAGLHERYEEQVVAEKARYIVYALLTIGLVLAGGLYVVVR